MSRLADYYAARDEWARLDSPAGLLELLRTLRMVEAHLSPGSRILDLGAGPGRYALALATRGHQVTVADLSRVQLDAARARLEQAEVLDRIEAFVECDARDLACFETGSFQAALCLGPFYHLTTPEDRALAAGELARVLAAGAPAFVAFIPRLAGAAALIARAARDPRQVPPPCFARALGEGIFENPVAGAFTDGYFAEPDEIRACLDQAGLDVLDLLSVRGMADGAEAELWQLEERDPERFEAALDLIERTASRPEVVATRGHALAICRRR